jgi:hypothetical protein
MAGSERKWVRVKALTTQEKSVVAASCERLIAETLKPRFLPEVHPTTFNYPIDIVGKWRGSKYSFITRYRSGFPENLGEEFDSSFSRLDHVEEHPGDLRFHVMWHRHTGQWFRLHALVKLDEALRLIASEERLWPL